LLSRSLRNVEEGSAARFCGALKGLAAV
jgi:hypothetical protein